MEIIRQADGTLVVPVQPERRHDAEDVTDTAPGSAVDGVAEDAAEDGAEEASAPATRSLHPGEGGYDEALAAWDLQQDPDRAPVVSTATGRQEAMSLVHDVATSSGAPVASAVTELDDPGATGEALRHVLVGGVHAVEDFAKEVAAAEGGDPLPAHETTKIIGEVLAELDG